MKNSKFIMWITISFCVSTRIVGAPPPEVQTMVLDFDRSKGGPAPGTKILRVPSVTEYLSDVNLTNDQFIKLLAKFEAMAANDPEIRREVDELKFHLRQSLAYDKLAVNILDKDAWEIISGIGSLEEFKYRDLTNSGVAQEFSDACKKLVETRQEKLQYVYNFWSTDKSTGYWGTFNEYHIQVTENLATAKYAITVDSAQNNLTLADEKLKAMENLLYDRGMQELSLKFMVAQGASNAFIDLALLPAQMVPLSGRVAGNVIASEGERVLAKDSVARIAKAVGSSERAVTRWSAEATASQLVAVDRFAAKVVAGETLTGAEIDAAVTSIRGMKNARVAAYHRTTAGTIAKIVPEPDIIGPARAPFMRPGAGEWATYFTTADSSNPWIRMIKTFSAKAASGTERVIFVGAALDKVKPHPVFSLISGFKRANGEAVSGVLSRIVLDDYERVGNDLIVKAVHFEKLPMRKFAQGFIGLAMFGPWPEALVVGLPTGYVILKTINGKDK